MSFYLFSGTIKREEFGDCIFDKSIISGIAAVKIVNIDETYFSVAVETARGCSYSAFFSTEEEAREAIFNLGVERDILANFVFAVINKRADGMQMRGYSRLDKRDN